jgi:hypothetical protein
VTFSAREDYVAELKKHIRVQVFGKCSGNPVDIPNEVGWEKTFQMIGKKINLFLRVSSRR